MKDLKVFVVFGSQVRFRELVILFEYGDIRVQVVCIVDIVIELVNSWREVVLYFMWLNKIK